MPGSVAPRTGAGRTVSPDPGRGEGRRSGFAALIEADLVESGELLSMGAIGASPLAGQRTASRRIAWLGPGPHREGQLAAGCGSSCNDGQGGPTQARSGLWAARRATPAAPQS